MTSEKPPHLGKPQVQQLNEKHGYFQYGDAQGNVSAAFANEAVAEYLRVNEEAQAVMAECGLSPRELLEAVRDFQTAVAVYLRAQDALDNREYHGINAEPHDTLMRRRNYYRDDLDSTLAKHKEV
ncbi:hypothetical protein [Comamonas sp. JNW]|uniref:hypothetical protein n=1 Tax=Comamonas sp. JNW TaxID=2170731 RepID=UPI000DE650B7|nr:hypothetical protein [Comamonas sp. JNW]PWB21355.1 hypothetical protein DCO45_02865 [Comamonas sp. JNW]